MIASMIDESSIWIAKEREVQWWKIAKFNVIMQFISVCELCGIDV